MIKKTAFSRINVLLNLVSTIIWCSLQACSPNIHFTSASKLPIHAWLGPPAPHTTLERYEELANAGFNHSFSGFGSADQMAHALDIAEQAGVKLFVSCPELKSQPGAIALRFKSHPALAGYYLRDEPNASQFDGLASWARKIQKEDSLHPCYINLFPTYASPEQLGTKNYLKHVEEFIQKVPVPFISFDHYPVVKNRLRSSWYKNLEIISKASNEAGLPFWSFALAVAHDPYPIAELEHLRLQVFSNMAYGTQGIQYFTYWTPTSKTWNFNNGPIKNDGSRSIVYDRVKQVNQELQQIAPIFLDAKVVSVGHLGSKIPKRTQPYQSESPVQSISTGGKGAIVSMLGKDGFEILAIVNRSFKEEITLEIRFDKKRKIHYMGKSAFGERLKGRYEKRTILPRDITIYA